MARVFYVITILLVGGPYPNKGISDPIYSLFAMEVVKERERGTTNGRRYAFVRVPHGRRRRRGGTMEMGRKQTACLIRGGVLATAFVLYYVYFVRLDGQAAPVLQPARVTEREEYLTIEGKELA